MKIGKNKKGLSILVFHETGTAVKEYKRTGAEEFSKNNSSLKVRLLSALRIYSCYPIRMNHIDLIS